MGDNQAASLDAEHSLPPEAEAELAALIARQQAARRTERAVVAARRSLWHTHHWPDEYRRCVRVRGVHLCRRCLVLYPIAFAVLAASAFGVAPWPTSFEPWIIWVLCLPATAEFLGEKLAGLEYSARRQVAVTALVALALGRGFAYELEDSWSFEFWGPVLVFGSIWFAAAVHEVQQRTFNDALEASVRMAEGGEATVE